MESVPKRSNYLVRKCRLEDQDNTPELENATPGQRIGLVWQLTLDAWAFRAEGYAPPPPRDQWPVRKYRLKTRESRS